MPLGIVNNEDFEAEIKNSGTPLTKQQIPESKIPEIMDPERPIVTSDVIIKKHNAHGRNNGDVNIPQSMRKLIGDTATFEGRASALQLATSLGVSPSSVSAYTHPESSANNLNETNKLDLSTFLTSRKGKISKRAINKLNLAISLMSEEKLSELDGRGLSTVAKDMAQVVKHMEPPADTNKDVKPVQFIMFAPTVNNESHYEQVIAKDNY